MQKGIPVVPAKGVVSCSYNKQTREVRNIAAASSIVTIEDFSSKLEALRLHILDIFRSADRRYIDTCSLMRDSFVSMLGAFGDDMKKEKMTIAIFPQVIQELKKLTMSEEWEKRMQATRALNIISSGQYQGLFVLAQTDMDFPLADRVICREMFNRSYSGKQLLITQDSKLAASVFNFCCAHSGNRTTVYRLNKHGFLAGYDTEAMELAPHVIVPDGYNEGMTLSPSNSIVRTYTNRPSFAVTPSLDPAENSPKTKTDEKRPRRTIHEYTHDAIANGIIFMSRDALVYTFADNGNPSFLARLQELYSQGLPVTVNILSSSLSKWLRERIAPWRHLFRIIAPANPLMSEEDALLAAMCTECNYTNGKHQLLISREGSLYKRIAKRTPKCYSFIEIWGTCLSNTGLLLDARRIKSSVLVNKAAYETVSQDIA